MASDIDGVRLRVDVKQGGSRPGPSPRLGALMALPALVPFALFFLWPLLKAARISLYEYDGFGPLDDWVGLDNYVRALTDSELWIALLRNVFVAAVNVVGGVGVGLLLAYGLFRKVAGWRFLQVALFIPFILPVAVIALIWRFIYEPNQGLLNSFLSSTGITDNTILWLGNEWLALPAVSIVWTWQHIPFAMIVLLAAMLRIPSELIDAAQIDGATDGQTLRHIVLPAIRPTAWLVTAIIILRVSKAFDVIFIMTGGGPANATTTGTLYLYKQAFPFSNYGYASALGFVIAIVLGGILPLTIRKMSKSNVEL